jgi:hypothetical protein
MMKNTDCSCSRTTREYEMAINQEELNPSRPNNDSLINEPREGVSLGTKPTTSAYKLLRPGREFRKQKTINNNIMIHHKQARVFWIFFQNVKGLIHLRAHIPGLKVCIYIFLHV